MVCIQFGQKTIPFNQAFFFSLQFVQKTPVFFIFKTPRTPTREAGEDITPPCTATERR